MIGEIVESGVFCLEHTLFIDVFDNDPLDQVSVVHC